MVRNVSHHICLTMSVQRCRSVPFPYQFEDIHLVGSEDGSRARATSAFIIDLSDMVQVAVLKALITAIRYLKPLLSLA